MRQFMVDFLSCVFGAIAMVATFEAHRMWLEQKKYGGAWVVRFSLTDIVRWMTGRCRLCFKCGAVFSLACAPKDCFCPARFYIERKM